MMILGDLFSSFNLRKAANMIAPAGTKRRSGRWVGDATKYRAQHRNDQNKRREYHADQLIFRQTRHRTAQPIEYQRRGQQHKD